MPNEPRRIHVIATPKFEKTLKHLRKKYPNIVGDLRLLNQQLKGGETPGDKIPGVGYNVFKVRIKNSDAGKGTRDGYRIVYYIETAERIILLRIYSKSEETDISTEEIRRIIQDYEQSKG